MKIPKSASGVVLSADCNGATWIYIFLFLDEWNGAICIHSHSLTGKWVKTHVQKRFKEFWRVHSSWNPILSKTVLSTYVSLAFFWNFFKCRLDQSKCLSIEILGKHSINGLKDVSYPDMYICIQKPKLYLLYYLYSWSCVYIWLNS